MLYNITLVWKSARYYNDFRLKKAGPEVKYQRLRTGLEQTGITLPALRNWAFVVECEYLDEHHISADCISALPKAELERLFVLELVPGLADRIEIKACPVEFARMAARN